ncbi:hypothetical protein XENOCAPTIV_016913, partial [Xenoophorus captivus]
LCAIHLAVLADRLQALRELLAGGADVEAQERSCGRTALHLATETNNVSLAGCLLLEVRTDQSEQRWRPEVVSMTCADPQRENFEPLFFREEEEEDCEGDDDEGYIPGTTPVNMATSSAGECKALSILKEALCQNQGRSGDPAAEGLCPQVQNLKVDAQIDSGVCDSGVELSTV